MCGKYFKYPILLRNITYISIHFLDSLLHEYFDTWPILCSSVTLSGGTARQVNSPPKKGSKTERHKNKDLLLYIHLIELSLNMENFAEELN